MRAAGIGAVNCVSNAGIAYGRDDLALLILTFAPRSIARLRLGTKAIRAAEGAALADRERTGGLRAAACDAKDQRDQSRATCRTGRLHPLPQAKMPRVGAASNGSSVADFGFHGDQRVRGIDIDERRAPLDRDLDHRFREATDQMARADVALQLHQIGEEAPRP